MRRTFWHAFLSSPLLILAVAVLFLCHPSAVFAQDPAGTVRTTSGRLIRPVGDTWVYADESPVTPAVTRSIKNAPIQSRLTNWTPSTWTPRPYDPQYDPYHPYPVGPTNPPWRVAGVRYEDDRYHPYSRDVIHVNNAPPAYAVTSNGEMTYWTSADGTTFACKDGSCSAVNNSVGATQARQGLFGGRFSRRR